MNNEQLTTNNEQLPDKDANSSLLIAHSSLLTIPGVDTARGITLTGGTLTAYRKVLTLFCKDVKERLSLLQNAPEEESLPVFITHVHSLKSASASIGAQGISSLAAGLEAVGKAGDLDFIRESLPDFVQQLTELVSNIDKALETEEPEKHKSSDSSLSTAHYPLLHELAQALESQNAAGIDRILEELNQKPLDEKTRETLDEISTEVLMTEFDKALKIIGSLISAQTE